jgi:type II secretory pathway component PulF
VPLLEAVDTLGRQYTGNTVRRGGRAARFGAALLLLRDRLSAGIGLAAAMAEQPGVFDELCVSLTDVGESAGTLESALDQLAVFKERSLAFKNRIVAVLIYPAFVLATALVTSTVLMTVVVPGLLGALAEAGKTLPWPTRVVKAVSDAVVHHGIALTAAIVVCLIAAKLALRTTRGRFFWDGAQLRFPLIGDLLRKQAIARLCIILATLLKSGVVFVRALQIAQRATPNLVLRDALHRCEVAVLAGRDISEALGETGVFPALVVRVIGIGQQSGRLEEMLERLASDYDQQVARATQRLTSILEPALILFLVVLVGFIAFATVMPLLEAADVS